MSSVALEPRTFRDTTSRLSRVWTNRAASLLILLALAAVAVAPAMSRGRLFPRPTPYVTTMQYAADRLRAGELPLWNPHEHFGEPVARDGRSALWYPGTLLLISFPQPHAWHAIALLHVWLAGAGAWMLASRYGLEPVPRLMCGVAYMLCGPIVLGLESAQANVLVWLPWAAVAVERLSERVTALRILLASLVLTVQFLGGDLLASVALVLTCTLALLIRAFWIGPKRWAAAIVASLFAVATALAASAVQWMPLVWPLRTDPLRAVSDLGRAWPWGAGPLIVAPSAPALFGAVPLVLAGIAVCSGRRPRAVVLWMIIAAALTLSVVAFEVWGRLGGEAVRGWPRPRVLVAGVCLAVALLAGFGIETVVALAAERAARLRVSLVAIAFGVAATAAVIAVYFVKNDITQSMDDVLLHCTRLLVAAAMVCAAALIVRSHELPQWRSRGWAWVALACAELLAFALPAMRGAAIRNLADASGVAAFLRGHGEPARFLHAGSALPAAFATWQSLEDAGGAGRGSPRYEAWSAAAVASSGRNGSEVLRVGNVRYLVADKDAPPPPPPWRQAHRTGSLTIYEDAEPLPRAWVAPAGRVVVSARHALEPLASTQPINPRQTALLDGADVAPAEHRFVAEAREPRSGLKDSDRSLDAMYTSPTPEEVRVTVPPFAGNSNGGGGSGNSGGASGGGGGGGGGWLIIADAFAPGWRASVDGQREPIFAAFGAFRAVRVVAGGGEVVFRYDPPGWRRALVLSTIGGGGMLLLLAWSALQGWRMHPQLPHRLA